MKRFLGYFILEFAIIFVVAYGVNLWIHGTMTYTSMAVSAFIAGGIIAATAAKMKVRRNAPGNGAEGVPMG